MKEKLTIYEAWHEDGDTTFSTRAGIQQMKKKGQLSKNVKKLHVITAATSEEAASIFNLRMGHGPYTPMGESQKCPKNCGSYFFPESSGECPYCGVIEG